MVYYQSTTAENRFVGHTTMREGQVPFATTQLYPDDPRWFKRARTITQPPQNLLDELRMLVKIVKAARKENAMILNSSWGKTHPDVWAAALIGLLFGEKARPTTVMMGCMWQRTPGLRGLIEDVVVKLADRTITLYAVQSTEELAVFPQTWGVSPEKMRFTPYFWTASGEDLSVEPADCGPYIFSGGNSFREYGPLVEAARRMPGQRFIFATKRLHGADLPPNAEAATVPHDRFMSLLRGAQMVVTPLRTKGMTRAAGQQTYLNAMLMGKLLIVSDAMGVRDHITHMETGLIVDGSAESYIDIIRWALDPANAAKVEEIRRAGQQVAREQFTFENHVTYLLTVLDEALALKAST